MSPQKMLVRDMHGWKSIPPNYAYDTDFIEKLLEHPVLSERERDMLHRRYIDKQTLQDIGIEYLITRERVRQIIDMSLPNNVFPILQARKVMIDLQYKLPL